MLQALLFLDGYSHCFFLRIDSQLQQAISSHKNIGLRRSAGLDLLMRMNCREESACFYQAKLLGVDCNDFDDNKLIIIQFLSPSQTQPILCFPLR